MFVNKSRSSCFPSKRSSEIKVNQLSEKDWKKIQNKFAKNDRVEGQETFKILLATRSASTYFEADLGEKEASMKTKFVQFVLLRNLAKPVNQVEFKLSFETSAELKNFEALKFHIGSYIVWQGLVSLEELEEISIF